MGASTEWRLDDRTAHLFAGPLQGRVLLSPARSHFLLDQWNGREAISFAVLSTGGPSAKSSSNFELQEVYVRGTDLVARYAQTPPHQISPQIYWRADHLPKHRAVKIEMVLSMQTELLDSDPQVSVLSGVLQDAELLRANSLDRPRFEKMTPPAHATEGLAIQSHDTVSKELLFVFRNESIGISYAQMVHHRRSAARFLCPQPQSTGRGGSRSPLENSHVQKG